MPPEARAWTRRAVAGWLIAVVSWGLALEAWPSPARAVLQATRVAVLYVFARG